MDKLTRILNDMLDMSKGQYTLEEIIRRAFEADESENRETSADHAFMDYMNDREEAVCTG